MSHFISLPDELIVESTRPLSYPKMLPEVEEWCAENLKDWFVVYRAFADRLDVNMPFEIFFESMNDAIYFKLRWIG